MDGTLIVLFLMVVGGVTGGTFIAGLVASHRRAQALAEPIGARCIACDSSEMIEQHPDAWACSSCGYEQGDGWVRRQEEAHLERLLALSPEEAQKQAHHMLRDAHLGLLSGDGPFANPVQIEGSGKNRREVVNPDLLTAMGDVAQAWKRVQEACLIHEPARAALVAAGFNPTATLPDDNGLYSVHSARQAALRIRAAAQGAARKVGATMRELGVEP